MDNMKVYFVATNVKFSAIVKAYNKRDAKKFAKTRYTNEYGKPENIFFWAYPIEEYVNDYEVLEVELL